MKLLFLMVAFCAVSADAIHQDRGNRRTIANGDPDPVTLYRYFTLLSDTATGAGTKRCAGILIHEDVVASSANCIYEQFVRLGSTPIIARTDYRSDSFSTSTHRVGSINNAPGFSPNSNTMDNDLVLLKLNSRADIPVPMMTDEFLMPDSFQVVGAGPTTDDGDWSNVLLQAQILPQDFAKCRNSYKALDARVNLNQNVQFCAGQRSGVAGGPCATADHGAPLMNTRGGSLNPSEHILMGIASFGNGCGARAPPYVFTRIRHFYTWIRLEICRLTVTPPLHCFTDAPSPSPSLSPSMRPTSTLEHPYFVLLSDVASGTGTVRCGGVLIHSDVVLTADSCTDGRLNFARIGFNEEGLTPLAVRAISGIISHPSSSLRGNFPANLALIRLSTPVTNVQPIRVNNISAVPSDNGDTVMFVSVGDSTSEDNAVTFHDRAVSDSIQTSNFNFCAQDYRDRSIRLEEGAQFCAGINSTGSGGPCGEGDFGGPLIVQGASASDDLLVGIASPPGMGCGPEDPPFIFTRVATYSAWIEKKICSFSSIVPDRCITKSPSPGPTTANPTQPPTSKPTTEAPTAFPTGRPTSPAPTMPPTSPAPTTSPNTDAPTDACRDQTGDILFVIENGVSSLVPCSWLNENDGRMAANCAPDSISRAAIFCESTCGICTRTPTTAPIESRTPTAAPIETNAPTAAPIETNAPTTAPIETNAPTTAPIETNVPTTAPIETVTPSIHATSDSPTLQRVIAVPTDAQDCVDSNTSTLFIIFMGTSSFQSCQYLIDNPALQGIFCTPTDISGAYRECLRTCGLCPDQITIPLAITSSPVLVPTTPAPITPFPVSSQTSAPITPPPVTPSPVTPSPVTPSPVVSLPCNDTDGVFSVVFNNVAATVRCQFLQENPQFIAIVCDNVVKEVCPKTCGVCSSEGQD